MLASIEAGMLRVLYISGNQGNQYAIAYAPPISTPLPTPDASIALDRVRKEILDEKNCI